MTLLLLAAFLVQDADRAEPRTKEYPWMSVKHWNERHEGHLKRAKEGKVDLLFLGDSITEGWGNNAVWKKRDAHAGDRARLPAPVGEGLRDLGGGDRKGAGRDDEAVGETGRSEDGKTGRQESWSTIRVAWAGGDDNTLPTCPYRAHWILFAPRGMVIRPPLTT